MKPSLIYHPYLFAIFPVLYLFSHNIEQLSLYELALPTLVASGLAAFLWLCLAVLIRDRDKRGILLSVFLIMFFSYGHVYNLLAGVVTWGSGIWRERYLVPGWCLIGMISVYVTLKAHRDLRAITRAFTMAGAILVVTSLFMVMAYQLATPGNSEAIGRSETEVVTSLPDRSATQDEPGQFPNIYYIILDTYASSNTLKEFFDYDNHELIDYLTDKGFYIAYESWSNYPETVWSLASSLNMTYLTDDVLNETERALRMIENSQVARELKRKGYSLVTFNSGWGVTGRNDWADVMIRCGTSWNEFRTNLIQTSLLRLSWHVLDLDYYTYGKGALCMFENLPEAHKAVKSPVFVFAHILPPHPPFVFGPNGERTSSLLRVEGGGGQNQKELYLGQLIFVTKKVRRLIEDILLEEKRVPIILLQADHGPGGDPQLVGQAAARRMRMAIFSAYYFPENASSWLYKSISPVNSFRVLFDRYFGDKYPPLEDRSYGVVGEQPNRRFYKLPH